MWNIDRPTIAAGDVFTISISRVANPGLRARLAAITPNVVQAELAYTAAASTASLHTFPATNAVGEVSKEELVDVYDYRMAKKGAPGRPLYDVLLAAPAYGRCPYCGHRRVATLDHHLPKSAYSILAVTPVNLVPACRDCNTDKLSVSPTTPEEVFLHPYFDVVDDQRWLSATVVDSLPPVLLFFINSATLQNDVTRARVQNHFNRLKLAALYSAHAAEELASIRAQMRMLFESGGAESVRAHLHQIADSKESARRNSWQTATYRALEESEYYCGGGFDF